MKLIRFILSRPIEFKQERLYINNKMVKKEFGTKVYLKLFICKFLDVYMGYRTSFYTSYLSKWCINEFDHIKNRLNYNEIKQEEKIYVWALWWQGIDTAPEIVKACIESQKRNFPKEKFEYVLLDQYNLGNYIELPECYKKNLKEKNITLTHLSDLIRTELLLKYGGIWIDATIYVTDRLNDSDLNVFFTNKKTAGTIGKNKLISGGRWTGCFMFCEKNNLLMQFMSEAFRYYWTSHKTLIEYLLIDYVIYAGYSIVREIREMVDAVPYNNQDFYKMWENINKNYSENLWKSITEEQVIHKLSYKGDILKDKNTIGGFICLQSGVNYNIDEK